ncbi:MAG: DUF11 domain-containing protein [Saprospiraceae bacterium]|nr:DUF11 domain-containing protein [Saprospiraceae bacterium]
MNNPDIDSDGDATNFNQTGETDDLLDDDVINQNGMSGGDEDDHDPAQIPVAQTFDLALKKTLQTTGSLRPGGQVTFAMTIYNQGTIDATNINVSDYIPTGLTLNDPTWIGNPATLVTPIPFLAKGDSMVRTITFTINLDYTLSTIRNWAEISAATNALGLSDVDSNPDATNFNQSGETDDLFDDDVIDQNGMTGGDEDDHDPAQINIDQFDFWH